MSILADGDVGRSDSIGPGRKLGKRDSCRCKTLGESITRGLSISVNVLNPRQDLHAAHLKSLTISEVLREQQQNASRAAIALAGDTLEAINRLRSAAASNYLFQLPSIRVLPLIYRIGELLELKLGSTRQTELTSRNRDLPPASRISDQLKSVVSGRRSLARSLLQRLA